MELEERRRVARTPRLYRFAASIYRGIVNREGSLKTLLNQKQRKHPNKRGIQGLVYKVLENSALIDEILEGTTILADARVDEHLTKVLIAEVLWGKGYVEGDSTAIKVIQKKQEFLLNRLKSRLSKGGLSCGKKPGPTFLARWARVNTLLISVEECQAQLEYLGWELTETPKTREEFVEAVKNLGETQYVVDFDFPTLFAFPPSVNILEWLGTLVEETKLLLQDKSSCIPPFVLKPRPGSHVIDACAAPGLKTLHIASLMKGAGKVTAVEMSEERVKVLEEYVKHGCADPELIEVKNADFLTLDPADYADVEYILVDPSCSGSGIARREDKLIGETVCKNRLAKLSGFQVKILRHALKFPSVKRVVYSTCSVMPQENEMVVRDVLAKPGIADEFQLKDIGRGDGGQCHFEPACPELYQCKRTTPEKDLCNGFFVAILHRRVRKKKRESL